MACWKIFVVAALFAVSQAYPQRYAPPAYTSQASNILRTPGNLGQISTYQKSIQTPYSSVTKADIRASNDALAYTAAAAPVAYAPAPAAYAPAPAPVAYAQRPVAYAPAPAPAPAPGVVRANLLGVAYSAAPAVAQITYSNPNDKVNYAY